MCSNPPASSPSVWADRAAAPLDLGDPFQPLDCGGRPRGAPLVGRARIRVGRLDRHLPLRDIRRVMALGLSRGYYRVVRNDRIHIARAPASASLPPCSESSTE